MRPLTPIVLFFALTACGGTWNPADLDGDGFTVAEGDCWENAESVGTIASADINPGATETWYDGFDQDCDGVNDFDKDGDGHASAAFPDPTGVLPSDDCWDDPELVPDGFLAADPSEQLDAAAVFPGADERWYDGIDQDCGGEDDFDQDGDGFASSTFADGEDCFDAEDDPFTNDGDLAPGDVNPDAPETWYDGTDADCAGDDDFDKDGDGFTIDAECDDEDAARYPDPSIPEVWYDGTDDNCDGNDGDQDLDGFYAADYAFEVPSGYEATDCWDNPASGASWVPLNGFDPLAPADVNPAADETWYDGLDQDCDGSDDFDQDADGFATNEWPGVGGGVGDDCDDSSLDVNPSATEAWYDGIDGDCSGGSDFDQDADGFDNGDDCDDIDDGINPGALETCGNVVDEDCSGSDNDEGAFGCGVYYADADADGFGADDDSACLCYASTDYAAVDAEDCDDSDAAVNPGGAESCLTTADDDCDGTTNAVDAAGCTDWYTDADNDTYGTTASQCACAASGTFRATNDDDCNDASSAIRPGATETCNTTDDDCDGTVDDGLPLYYTDADDDTYGAGAGTCTSSGRVSNNSDCDDSTDTVYPGADEICDGEPNDCTTAGSWTEDSEDGLASYVDTAGEWTDTSGSFTTVTGNYSLQTSGTYYFCGGTFYAKLLGSNDSVDIVGIYGAAETTIDNNSTTGPTVSITGGSVTLSGLTITGGHGSGTSGNTTGGGVIAGALSTPTTPTVTLEDCVVSGNTANVGGGVAAFTYSTVALVRTRVTGNSATTTGGGVSVSSAGRLTAEDSEIDTNAATTSGGGIYLTSTGTAALTGTDVHDNTATVDGAGIYLDDGSLTLSTSFVYDNVSSDDGGGLFIDTGTASCTSGGIYGNTAADHGGGVYLSNYTTTLATFSASSCDFGTGATDNSPSDVTIKTAVAESSGSYTDYAAYSATATFICSSNTDLCG